MSFAAERFVLHQPWSLEALGVRSTAGNAIQVTAVARFGLADEGTLCFCDREPSEEVQQVPSGCIVLCTEALALLLRGRFRTANLIAVEDPRAAFIDAGQILLRAGAVQASNVIPRPYGVHPSAFVGANTFIDPEARVDEGASIGHNCMIGRGCWIQTGAVVRDNTVIGVEGINAYRGADGRQRNFPHFAGVVIGEGVQIGANCVIVGGILNSTQIGRGSIIGNLCNIGHVVDIGANVWMSVGCLIGGHTRIADNATLGMGVTLKDNIEVGENAQVGMGSVVTKPVAARSSVFGIPARPVGPIQAGPER